MGNQVYYWSGDIWLSNEPIVIKDVRQESMALNEDTDETQGITNNEEVNLDETSPLDVKQSNFIKQFSTVMYEHEIQDVTASAMITFDINEDGFIDNKEAPFLLLLANKFISVDTNYSALKSKEYIAVSELLRGKSDRQIESSQELYSAQVRLNEINAIIERELAGSIFYKIDKDQVEQALLVSYHWSDVNMDGLLTDESDLPFLSVVHSFERNAETEGILNY